MLLPTVTCVPSLSWCRTWPTWGKKKHYTSSSASNGKEEREELPIYSHKQAHFGVKMVILFALVLQTHKYEQNQNEKSLFCLIPANPPVASLIPVMSTGLALPAVRWEVLWLGTRTAHASLWSAWRWLLPADSIIHTHTALSLSATKTSLTSSLSACVGCIINCAQLSVLSFFSDAPLPSETCLSKMWDT